MRFAGANMVEMHPFTPLALICLMDCRTHLFKVAHESASRIPNEAFRSSCEASIQPMRNPISQRRHSCRFCGHRGKESERQNRRNGNGGRTKERKGWIWQKDL
jgi:hypothetical protein